MFYIFKDNRKSLESNYELVGTYETLEEAYASEHCSFWNITSIYKKEAETTEFIYAQSVDVNNIKYYIYPESTAKLYIK